MTKAGNRPPTPEIPVSWGELIDKITILEIKSAKLAGGARDNVRKELALLQRAAARAVAADGEIAALKAQLTTINEQLWHAEDRLREKEKTGEFDDEFVALARSVYGSNDARAALKRRINLHLESEIVEEKSYGSKAPE